MQNNPKRNLAHLTVLAVWGVMGAAFTLKCLFGDGAGLHSLTQAGMWWLWFAGLAAVTTATIRQVSSPIAALGIHAATFLVLSAIPKVFPLSVLRMGLDLLGKV